MGNLPRHVATGETCNQELPCPATGAGPPIPASRALKETQEATEPGFLDFSHWMDIRKCLDSIFLNLERPLERPSLPWLCVPHALPTACSVLLCTSQEPREALHWCHHRHPAPSCSLPSANTKPYILGCDKSLFNCLEEEIH